MGCAFQHSTVTNLHHLLRLDLCAEEELRPRRTHDPSEVTQLVEPELETRD